MRYRNKFIYFKDCFIKNSFFFKKLLSNSGRNFTGKICVLSKTHKRKTKNAIYSSLKNLIPQIFLNIWTTRSNFSNKKSCILRSNKKTYLHIPCIYGNVVGSLVFYKKNIFIKNKLIERLNQIKVGMPCFLKKVPFRFKTSNLFLFCNLKPKIATAPGTFFLKIVAPKREKLLKIVLPSKKIIFVSTWSLCFFGVNVSKDQKFFMPGKAGVNRLNGKKQTVRGVAKNPVDHPNGGRTKSCSPERSPWGWVAKLNK